MTIEAMGIKYFDPFYDFARRKLNLGPRQVDALIRMPAVARIDGHTIRFSVGGTDYLSAHVGLGHARHATKWVNQFNDRA